MVKTRCPWADTNDWNKIYHDTEWGVPVHDDTKLFEFLVLDAFQAGLSWVTILKKRENFRKAFDHFNANIIASYTEDKIQSLMQNANIIRNQMKIRATVDNAQSFLQIQEKYGSFDKYIWQFTNYQTLVNSWINQVNIPASSKESDEMSRSLKTHGFKFVGTTICYAFMQAAGMVNDHTIHCFRYQEVQQIHQSDL
ncbi:DNA-3-methyladenine glycosylase I [Microbacter margulisiae]|uniref:DNA-3-methyladenine glycosylase I n=1 Tax=Microbacter margulisiae TaxID=1350067 RepID=A0A7W5DP94_9PORP|nr:DNA-3-methyladenine glycosylase I [Microbacter margulisiae]MBB3186270.1 DNA-3-methyladenine glycosylase I [Microbacter margulisiae]